MNLVDMMDFSRMDFDKFISLNAKKKIKIESRWDIVKIGDVIYENQKSKIQVGIAKEIKNGKYKFFTSGESEYSHDDYLIDGENIYLSTGGNAIVKYFKGKASYSTDTFAISTNQENICTQYLFYFLENIIDEINLNYFKGVGLRHLQKNDFRNIQLPLPPKNIQEKIINEIETLEVFEKDSKEKVENYNQNMEDIINSVVGESIKLKYITNKIGSGSTPKGGEGSYQETGISLIRSQNIHDNRFIKKGLAFIDEIQAKKLNNVEVLKNDILFNITGASVARCCIVEDKYLPARVNQHVSIIRTNEKALYKYVQKCLINNSNKIKLLEIAQGGTSREAITKVQLEEFEIILPSLQEQQQIVKQIEEIEDKIQNIEKELETIPTKKAEILKKYI
jgi:restriction endonuclease S subunit